MRELESKLVSIKAVETLSQELHKQGKKIVTTNGCFDLLHLGHIKYLREARNLGDVLIIGVNSDPSVRKLKGPDRPLTQQSARALQLAGLESVDYVVIFEEDTPERLLGLIKPAIHVKGGDYLPQNLPERKVVEAHGGKVVCVSLVAGYSTTKILERISKPSSS